MRAVKTVLICVVLNLGGPTYATAPGEQRPTLDPTLKIGKYGLRLGSRHRRLTYSYRAAGDDAERVASLTRIEGKPREILRRLLGEKGAGGFGSPEVGHPALDLITAAEIAHGFGVSYLSELNPELYRLRDGRTAQTLPSGIRPYVTAAQEEARTNLLAAVGYAPRAEFHGLMIDVDHPRVLGVVVGDEAANCLSCVFPDSGNLVINSGGSLFPYYR